MDITRVEDPADHRWLSLRAEFIPERTEVEHRAYLEVFGRLSRGFAAFIAEDGTSGPLGFVEVSLRHDYVNGCEHRPVLYLEGLFVRPAERRRGVARALCAALERWAHANGCRELASDAYADDEGSRVAHAGLGFEETESVVYFRKPIAPQGEQAS